jgi:hypothetical protein
MTTYNIHDLAMAKGTSEPVREALLGMQERIQLLYEQLGEAEKQLDAQYKLGMEAEREACAVIAETPVSGEQDDITMQAKDRVAAAIRARGEKK